MDRIIYLVQPYSRGADGALRQDPPAWSCDHGFAVALSRALARRKAGVVTLRTTLTENGDLGAESDVIVVHGTVPTSFAVQGAESPAQPARRPLRAVGGTGLKRRA